MDQLKVGSRLALGFGLLLLLVLAAVAVGLLGIRSAEEQASRMERESVALLRATSAMQVAQLNEGIAVRDFVELEDVEGQRAAVRSLQAGQKAYAGGVAELERVAGLSANREELLAVIQKLKSANGSVAAKVHEAMDLVDSAEYQQAQSVVYKQVRPLQVAIAGDLKALAGRAHALAQERAHAARLEAEESEQHLALALAAALLLGIAATVLITRGIVRPLGRAVAAAERVAGGDLTELQVRGGRDETGRVLGALADMQRGLNTLVRSVRLGADAVNQASDRIAAGNGELSARTEEQAAALEETAASVEEFTASVKQNSDNALRGRDLANEAAELATAAGTAVSDVTGNMDGIQRSARRVSDIVGLMDEIAFQTNLLALNAAVEAARAGEHGRGFGVVAAQVRVLAQRSAEAARDIKQLAREAVGQADTGARAAERAGETMDKVVRVARDVAHVVADIARASEEQRTGIEQVNATIAQLDTATQSNAMLVQQINELADSLLTGSRELVASAKRFRLDAQEGRAATPAPKAQGTPQAGIAWTQSRPALLR
jgi:methyl-accepting chemotaxis protein